jgi:hypothetical protein
MTELEETELTGGQGRALSAHRGKTYERCATLAIAPTDASGTE